MTSSKATSSTVPALNAELRALVRLAGAICGSPPAVVSAAIDEAVVAVRPIWAEEVILQSHLFAGLSTHAQCDA